MALLPRRRGVTLVELVVALSLFGVVAGIILTVLRDQQRFHVGSLEIIETKRSVHDAVDLLYGALRGVATADIHAITDSSISFRTTMGASHVCAIDASRSRITLPSPGSTRVRGLTTFLTIPRAGDSVLIFDPGGTPAAEDDGWKPHALVADMDGGACPSRPFGLAASGGETAGVAISVNPPLSEHVVVGSSVRFFRPATYSLYRGSGASWMLGYSACAAGTCTVRQPLSGPYVPFAAGGAGGLTLRYFDADGAPTIDRSRVVRVDVASRARSRSALDVGHVHGQRYHDSLAITIALRNPR